MSTLNFSSHEIQVTVMTMSDAPEDPTSQQNNNINENQVEANATSEHPKERELQLDFMNQLKAASSLFDVENIEIQMKAKRIFFTRSRT
eukprot:jgi/Botrbrau1/13189/Bobra.0351s0002.1